MNGSHTQIIVPDLPLSYSREKNHNKIKEVSFRKLVPEITRSTYGAFGLYRYPAKFIPQVVASILKKYGDKNMKLLDPFAGCGTTGLVSKTFGYDYELWDLNPMLKVIHSVATTEPLKIDIEKIIEDMQLSKTTYTPPWSNLSYWFPEEFLPLLKQVWGYYHTLNESYTKRILVLPLLKTTRKFSYNDEQRQKLSKSPLTVKRVEKLLRSDWKKIFFDSIRIEIQTTIKKLDEYQKILPKPNHVKSKVIAGLDVIDIPRAIIDSQKWDAIITSPPYLQAQEYIRNSKMDLFWLGYNEEAIRSLSKKELPYRVVKPIPIFSKTYQKYHEMIKENHLKQMFENYFNGVLGTLTTISYHVSKYLFIFVGQSSVRAVPIPIDGIFTEHFGSLGWKHLFTLSDKIPSRVMFKSKKNPATGLKDVRISKENLVVLKRI